MYTLDREQAMMDLKRIFISPNISTDQMVKVKAVYNELRNSAYMTVDLDKKVSRIKSGKF